MSGFGTLYGLWGASDTREMSSTKVAVSLNSPAGAQHPLNSISWPALPSAEASEDDGR
jgi:hypothetical protein